ncbi:MAG TPA: hypothetical protein VK422_10755, partial [Pyrinomonadaceae bacterium]|nr:hypothetical protein [Pyrinomonadaceae bacterium]
MLSKRLARLVLLQSLILGGLAPALGQGFQVERKNPPAAAAAGPFTSLEGRFSIALPRQISGFKGIAFETPKGEVTAGDSYSWRLAGAHYEVGYIDKSKTPRADADTGELVLAFAEGVAAQAAAQQGKVLSNREITASGLPGREVRLELPQMHLISRVVGAGDRIYQLTAVLKKDAEMLAAAGKILDSFRVLSVAEAQAAIRKSVEAATPDPLPQEPVAARPKSDAEDEGLRGKVKTVFTESEDLSGTWSVQGRKPSSMEYYDGRGNLTKRESYDYKGNPSDITVYGYLGGERVSDIGTIQREYNPPPIMVGSAPGAAKPKRDPRYTYKFKFKYDDAGRLLEKSWFMSDGEPWLRYVYDYKGNRKEKLVYSADGS